MTFVQYEKSYTAALGYLHKVYIMAEYRKKEHEIVDLDKVTAATQLPTMTKKVAQLTPLGKETLRHCIFEAEHRFCNNNGDTLLNKKICMSDREKISIFWDIQTVGAKHMIENR